MYSVQNVRPQTVETGISTQNKQCKDPRKYTVVKGIHTQCTVYTVQTLYSSRRYTYTVYTVHNLDSSHRYTCTVYTVQNLDSSNRYTYTLYTVYGPWTVV